MKKKLKKILRSSGYEIRRTRPLNDTEAYIQKYGRESVEKHRFYNICGSGHLGFGGGFIHPCWTNVDFEKGWSGAGFTTVYPLSPNQSAAPVMRNHHFFDNLWNHVALFMEAIK